ncbi:hypothetical protein CFP75_19400 [Amycolatopsis alba DSM 44262]|uniref:HAF repeat-containing protein n=1 Tax=Amycolatopsis alba DSM 44262 TaxID=1125972 RepID=A0A229RRY2_AMYAL|nr:hypothetical protein CFP75_19400 [Amycolatopsis alba DSM 44262]
MVLAATVAAGLLSTGTASASDWTMSYLPLPPGGSGTARVAGTNGAGGYAGTADGRLVTWNGGTVVDHGVPDGYTRVEAADENASGSVLGSAVYYSEGSHYPGKHAFAFENGEFQFLGKVPGYYNSQALGTNDRGDVVGTVFNDIRYGSTAAFWPSGDREHPVKLDVPPLLSPVDIDQDGTILLNEQFGGTWLWKDGVLRQLVLPDGLRESRGIAIRNGKVLASTQLGDRLWTAFDTSQEVPSGMSTMALNGSGLVTGWVSPRIPTAWSPGDPVTALPSPGNAYGTVVGENGEIAGTLESGIDGIPVVWRRG